jgi:Barstar (barnase inhibitor)
VKERALDEEGFKHIIIDGEECHDVHSLFKEFAHKLRFPSYVGENWYAFDECINDLSWMQADGYVIFISNADKVLPGDDERFEILIQHLVGACMEWEEGRDYGELITPPTPFNVVLHCTPEKEEETEARVDRLEL